MAAVKERLQKRRPQLSAELGVSNPLALPRLSRLAVSVGVGRVKDKKRLDFIVDRLAKITGQKPSPRGAKKAIAGFKSRLKDVVGLIVTLRGQRLYGFLDKLLSVVIPRIRDFRGFDESSVDATGNLTLGISEHTVFPETADEELKDVFGLAITIVTTARNRKQALALFRAIGFPFKK